MAIVGLHPNDYRQWQHREHLNHPTDAACNEHRTLYVVFCAFMPTIDAG